MEVVEEFLGRDGFFNLVSDESLYGVASAVAVSLALRESGRGFRHRTLSYREMLSDDPERVFRDGGNPVFLGLDAPPTTDRDVLTVTPGDGDALSTSLSELSGSDEIQALLSSTRYRPVSVSDGKIDAGRGLGWVGGPVESLALSLHPTTRYSGRETEAEKFLDDIDVPADGGMDGEAEERYNTALTTLALENEGAEPEVIEALLKPQIVVPNAPPLRGLAFRLDATLDFSPSRCFSKINDLVAGRQVSVEQLEEGYRNFQLRVANITSSAYQTNLLSVSGAELHVYEVSECTTKELECTANVLDLWRSSADGAVAVDPDGLAAVSMKRDAVDRVEDVFDGEIYGGKSRYFTWISHNQG